MEIKRIEVEKDRYLPLLLLADDYEHIMTYLAKGELFVLMNQSEVKAVCGQLNSRNRKSSCSYCSTGAGLWQSTFRLPF